MTTTAAADRDLVEGLQRHDPGAAGRLAERYAGWIQQVVCRWLSDIRDVEEVTQDVLFTATQKIGQFDGRAAFSTWLYRIAVNQARDRLRQRRARTEIALEPSLPVLDAKGRRADLAEDWSRRDGDPVTPLTPHDMPDLEPVISTAEFRRRPSRAPDYAAENRALVALAQEMAVSPNNILQKPVETV